VGYNNFTIFYKLAVPARRAGRKAASPRHAGTRLRGGFVARGFAATRRKAALPRHADTRLRRARLCRDTRRLCRDSRDTRTRAQDRVHFTYHD